MRGLEGMLRSRHSTMDVTVFMDVIVTIQTSLEFRCSGIAIASASGDTHTLCSNFATRVMGAVGCIIGITPMEQHQSSWSTPWIPCPVSVWSLETSKNIDKPTLTRKGSLSNVTVCCLGAHTDKLNLNTVLILVSVFVKFLTATYALAGPP